MFGIMKRCFFKRDLALKVALLVIGLKFHFQFQFQLMDIFQKLTKEIKQSALAHLSLPSFLKSLKLSKFQKFLKYF